MAHTMTSSLLRDAFAHHVWATETLIDACAQLTGEQLPTPERTARSSTRSTTQDPAAASASSARAQT